VSEVALADEVLELLRSSKLDRKDEAVSKAATLSRVDAPASIAGMTPRFEAFFAIATLEKALKNREDVNSIRMRHEFALLLAGKWLQATKNSAPS